MDCNTAYNPWHIDLGLLVGFLGDTLDVLVISHPEGGCWIKGKLVESEEGYRSNGL